MKVKFEKLRQAAHEKMKALLTAAADSGKPLSDEQTTQLASLTSEIASYDNAIKAAEAAEKRELELASVPAPTDPPVAGTETAGGGTGLQIAANANIQVGAIGQKAAQPFESLGQQLAAIRDREMGRAASGDRRLEMVTAAATGGSVHNPSDGGWQLQQNFSNTILESTIEVGGLFEDVTKQPITVGNSIVMNYVKDKDCSGGSVRAGIKAYLSDEAETVLKSKPQFERFELSLRKLSAVCWGTDELLDDVPAFEAYIMANMPAQIAYQIDEMIMFGDGSKGPLGIFNSAAMITQAIESGQTISDPLLAKNVMRMAARVFRRSPKAKFYYNQEHEVNLPGLYLPTGSNAGVLLYTPPGGITGKPTGAILGITAKPLANCPAPGTKGDIFIADMSEYMWIDKGGIKAQQSIHVEFLKGERVFKFDYRMNGAPAWKAVHVPPKNTAFTQSPFVCLGTRS